jgi:large subunit ribosomal protein L4e
VNTEAGHQTSAQSWGTGRAVARIPRVGGGGTGRSGQGAFGNMCRSGRMFAPTRIWRRWHRKVNVNQRRYALVSALAASAIPALVQARGHRIDNLAEVPLVLSGVEGILKTKEAAGVLAKIGALADVDRAKDSKTLRAGKGKLRGRRYVSRRGPLVVYDDATKDAARAFRNLPGVDLVHVERLNLLQLAPGGHLGRFVIWTSGAFASLDALFGTWAAKSTRKAGYALPRPQMANADLARLINSNEVQKIVRPAVKDRVWAKQKKNPLRNLRTMIKLNPYAAKIRETEINAAKARAAAKASGKKTVAKKTGTRYNLKRLHASKNFAKAVASDEFSRPGK